MSLSYGTYASPPPSSYVPSAPLATESAPVSIIAPATPNTTETTLPAVPVAEPVATTPVIVQTFFSKQAVFTVINKRTAAREHVTVTSGIGTMSERVEITLHQCSIDKTGIVAEHAALVEIFAPQGVDERASVYKGWLSANHPELTVMVHPEYDITLMRCIEEKAEPLAVTTPEPSPSSPPE